MNNKVKSGDCLYHYSTDFVSGARSILVVNLLYKKDSEFHEVEVLWGVEEVRNILIEADTLEEALVKVRQEVSHILNEIGIAFIRKSIEIVDSYKRENILDYAVLDEVSN